MVWDGNVGCFRLLSSSQRCANYVFNSAKLSNLARGVNGHSLILPTWFSTWPFSHPATGVQAHLSVDEDGLIKAADFTSGSVHDSNCFTDLLEGDESAVYADSAYQSQKHADWLSQQGIGNRLTKRAYRNRPLTAEDRFFNRTHSSVRSTVERVFGVLKLHYGMAKARYLGIKRNRTRFQLMCVAHNIKRGRSIQRANCAWKTEWRGESRCVSITIDDILSLLGKIESEKWSLRI
jgi:hypothetical protein